jgi:hypothetical protein
LFTQSGSRKDGQCSTENNLGEFPARLSIEDWVSSVRVQQSCSSIYS